MIDLFIIILSWLFATISLFISISVTAILIPVLKTAMIKSDKADNYVVSVVVGLNVNPLIGIDLRLGLDA